MINTEIKLTAENEFLKGYLLKNYDTTSISIAYGSFYNHKGYFSLGKKNDGKICFFCQTADGIHNVEMDSLNDDEKLKLCMELVGVIRNEEPSQIEEPKESKVVQTSIFDFDW